jgi:chromosome segregation ATPase
MYKELLEEAGGNKNLDEKITDNEEKIKLLKRNLKQKNDILSHTKRQIENFEYVVLKNSFF